MIKAASYVMLSGLIVGGVALLALQHNLPIGPVIPCLGVVPKMGLFFTKSSFMSAVPDLVFGAIDTGLLVIPNLWGEFTFGIVGGLALENCGRQSMILKPSKTH